MKPKHKFNNGNGATLCNRCNVIITKGLTKHLLCNKCIADYVYEYPVKSKWGFNPDELKAIVSEFPDINMDKFNLAMMGNTCMLEEDKIIIYPCDVVTALRCGIENRDVRFSEFD